MTVALDVAIGLVFLYSLLALIVTTLQELVATLFRLRARHLYDAVAGMLEGTDDAKDATKRPLKALFEHPLIRNLTNEKLGADGLPGWGNRGLPSYIPSKTFAVALLDVLRDKRSVTEATGAAALLADAESAVQNLPAGSQARKALELLLRDAKSFSSSADDGAKRFNEALQGWFNDRMARGSGWYKRKAQAWSLLIAAAVTLLANADTIHVVDRLWSDGALRSGVVASAQQFAASHAEPAPSSSALPPPDDVPAELKAKATLAQQQTKQLETSQLPIGWNWVSTQTLPCARLAPATAITNPGGPGQASPTPSCWSPKPIDGVLLVGGWLITVLALSLGAGFWFDMLSKVLSLRGSGPRVSESDGKIETR